MTQEIVVGDLKDIEKKCKISFFNRASILKTNAKQHERLDMMDKKVILEIANEMEDFYKQAEMHMEIWRISRHMWHFGREMGLPESYQDKLSRYLPEKFKKKGSLQDSNNSANAESVTYKKFRESRLVNGLTAAFEIVEADDIQGASKTTLMKVDEIVESFKQQITSRLEQIEQEEYDHAQQVKADREVLNQKQQDGEEVDYVSNRESRSNNNRKDDGIYDYNSLNNFDQKQHDALEVVAQDIKEKYGVRVKRSDSIVPVYTEEDIDRLEGIDKEMAIAQVNLDMTFYRTIRAFEKFRDISRQYPATDLMTMNRMIISLESLIEVIMPYIDGKFRRDLYQFLYISKDAIEVSPTYAAKNSGIPCATVLDPKTNQPVIRRMTKEQIEQVFPDKINQFVRLVNDNFTWMSVWSRKFVQNQCRAGEDRAVLISDKLSFLT